MIDIPPGPASNSSTHEMRKSEVTLWITNHIYVFKIHPCHVMIHVVRDTLCLIDPIRNSLSRQLSLYEAKVLLRLWG